MTRQRAISHLKDISMWGIVKADEYNALKMAIKALEQEPKIVPIAEIKFDDDKLHEIVEEAVKNIEIEPKWIPVSERKAEFPCIATDEYGNYPFIPSGVVEIDGCCYDGENFNFNVEEFLKGEEVILDGEKAYMPPRKIIAWMPLPEPYKEG